MVLRITLYALAALLLGAHFLRAGNLVLMALCVLTPLLFLWRHHASLVLLQLAAYGAAATWLWVAWRLIELREQTGQRWTAAAIILGSVAAYSVVAGLLLNSRKVKQHYPG